MPKSVDAPSRTMRSSQAGEHTLQLQGIEAGAFKSVPL